MINQWLGAAASQKVSAIAMLETAIAKVKKLRRPLTA
jgi:hypothetical protein